MCLLQCVRTRGAEEAALRGYLGYEVPEELGFASGAVWDAEHAGAYAVEASIYSYVGISTSMKVFGSSRVRD